MFSMARLVPIGMMLLAATLIHMASTAAINLFPVVGTWAVSAARMLFASAILIAFTRPKVWRWTKDQWVAVFFLGLALGFMIAFYYAAIETIPIGTALAIEFLGPLTLGAVLSRSFRDFAGVFLALIGMGFVALDSFTGTALDWRGCLWALAAACCWATYIVAGKRTAALVPGLGGLAVAFGIGGLAMLPIARGNFVVLFTDWDYFGLALITGLVGSAIPFSLELMAMRRLPTNVYSVLTSLEPVVGAAIGFIMLGQTVGLFKIIAIGLVITASIVQSVRPPQAVSRRMRTVARVGRNQTRRVGRGIKRRVSRPRNPEAKKPQRITQIEIKPKKKP